MLKHIIDAAYQLAVDNGLNEVCKFIAAVPVNSFNEVFHGAKTPEDVIAIVQEEIEMEMEMEEKDVGEKKLDLMYKVMMDDKVAIEKLHILTCIADKLATKCAEVGLDIGTLCGLMATMIDKYQFITKVSHEEIYAAWDIVREVREKVNAVCGDPLEMSGI